MRKLILITILLVLVGSTAFGQGYDAAPRGLAVFTVGSLPSAALWTNKIVLVVDGTSNSDCTVGGASTLVLCVSNGGSWVTAGGATGLPVSAITGLGANVAAFLANATSANLAAAMTNETGSSLLVFNTSPLLVTPSVTVINDGNGNPFLASSATASAVDGLGVTTSATGNPATVGILPFGSDANIILSLTGKGTAGVQFPNGFTTSATPPSSSVCNPIGGTSGAECFGAGTTPTGTFIGVGVTWQNAASNRLELINNGSTSSPIPTLISADNFTNKTFTTIGTATNCTSSASPAVCGAAAAGSAVIAASATTVVVNTTAVTANSQIVITEDQGLGTKLSVTCNTQSSLVVGTPRVTARVAATSFTVAVDVGPTTNPLCFSYSIVN